MGCVGEMVLLRLMVGGLEERSWWSREQGPREKAGVRGRTGDGISLSPRLSGHPDAAQLRVLVQMTVRQR